ncbi:hypothetical protein E2C01_070626 [Portunus trituberculatus]|uniref:Uncharacterized protein n=1 Tax=Portunus trituberculatus TaxID=210409 RepID=A0A5B7I2S5_PORTR|nr:hypothetical protein [Portunus trituberculatus]
MHNFRVKLVDEEEANEGKISSVCGGVPPLVFTPILSSTPPLSLHPGHRYAPDPSYLSSLSLTSARVLSPVQGPISLNH